MKKETVELLFNTQHNVLIFGDSLSHGQWDKGGGWVQHLRQVVDESLLSKITKKYYKIYNLSITKETSESILKRFEAETVPRIKSKDETVIIFQFGTNDSALVKSTNQTVVELSKFEQNVAALADSALKLTSKVAFIGIPPVDETRPYPPGYDPEWLRLNQQIYQYDRAIKRVCDDKQVKFIDVYPQFEHMNHIQFLFDGLHLDSNGHEVFFLNVLKGLYESKIINLK